MQLDSGHFFKKDFPNLFNGGLKMRVKSIAVIISFFLVCTGLFASGEKEKGGVEGKPYKGTEIVFAAQPTPTLNLLKDYLPEFEESTGIKVTFDLMPYESLVQKITLDTTANTEQYSCFWTEPTWLGRFADEFEPLDPYLKDPVLGKGFNIDEFSSKYLDEVGRYDGNLLAIPWESCQMPVTYRVDLFEKMNIEIPETFDEYLDAVKKLNTLPDVNGISLMGKRGQPVFYEYMPYMWGYGAEFFDKNMKPTINSPEAVKALEYMVELSKYAPLGVASYGWEESATAFLQGNVAIAQMFTDWIPALKDPESSKVIGKWNFMATPRGPGGRATPAGVISLSINKDVDQEKKDASFLFLKWALSEDILKRVTKVGACPARLTVFNLPEFESSEYAYFDAMKEMFDITRVPMQIPEFFELNDALSIELSAAIAGDKSSQRALDEAQKKWEVIMKNAGYY